MGAAGQLIVKRYRLVRALGQGSMGIVWEGHDTLLDRVVAVRQVLFPPELRESRQAELIQRLAREARQAERLRHPHIAAVHDVAEEDGTPYIVMELVRSRSLDGIVASEGPLAPERAATIARNVLSALTYAHASGVRHGDVRPANILVGHDGRVLLADFGTGALVADPAFGRSGPERSPAHGNPVSATRGVAAFLAPERANGAGATAASDLWSLGATVHLAVTARPPGATPQDVPGPLGTVVRGLLAKEPRRRLSPEAAEHALAELDVVAPVPLRTAGRSRTRLIAGIAAAALVAGAVGGWAVLRPGSGAAVSRTPLAATGFPQASPSPAASPKPAKPLRLTSYRSPEGWRAAPPRQWTRRPTDSGMRWYDPRSGAQLTVEVTTQGGTDPLGALREARASLRPTATVYREVRLKHASTKGGTAADWEFGWTPRTSQAYLAKGVAYHQYRRIISSGATTSVVTWTTTADQWDRLRPTLVKSFSLFTPPTAG
jgi:serine/threonine protein kinase